jgi:hypothetical protein
MNGSEKVVFRSAPTGRDPLKALPGLRYAPLATPRTKTYPWGPWPGAIFHHPSGVNYVAARSFQM